MSKIILLLSLVFGFLVYQNCIVFAQPGIINVQGDFSKVKVGAKAPQISLIDLNGKVVNISFDKQPTVLLYLNHYQNVVDVKEYNNLYRKWKGKANFYIIADSRNKEIEDIFDLKKLSVPILLEKENEYTKKYNQVDSSLVIIDGKEIIKYNSSSWVVLKELDHYIQKIVFEKVEESPQFSAILLNQCKKTVVPNLLLNGQQAGCEIFKTVKNKDYILKYKGKPTVMLFWLNISQKKMVRDRMNLMQTAFEKSGGKVRFFSIACSVDKDTLHYVTNGWNYSIPILNLDGCKYLRYVRGFPSFIFIDKNGLVHHWKIDTEEKFMQAVKYISES